MPVLKRGNIMHCFVLRQVFNPGQPKPVFFVASRGHHADIGGSAPGMCVFSIFSYFCFRDLPKLLLHHRHNIK